MLAAIRLGGSNDKPQSGIRLSLGRGTQIEDIDALILALKEIMGTMIIKA